MFILIFGPSKRVLLIGSFGYRWVTGSPEICATALTGDRNVYTYFSSFLIGFQVVFATDEGTGSSTLEQTLAQSLCLI